MAESPKPQSNPGDMSGGKTGASRLDTTPFAHPSEREAAKILEFYRIKWEYEPTSFPIAFDKKGSVIQSFTPDFYLPDLDLYIELTTMSQKLVTKKNRKVRRLRELYPNVRIKIFYQKDFRSLLLKYGMYQKPDGSHGAEASGAGDD